MTQRSKKAMAYGGVVFDDEGRILLREVAGHYGGYVYTFAKGRPDPGETPEQTALREVREETGIEAEIVGELPGVFPGDTTDTKFFVMRVVRDHGDFGAETRSRVWADSGDAMRLVSLSTTAAGRARDRNVLEAALAARRPVDRTHSETPSGRTPPAPNANEERKRP